MFNLGVISYNNSIAEPAVLFDSNTVAWFDTNVLSTITKDGSNFVSRWNDRLASGHDLIQSTGAAQPLYSANGILFDGTSDFMQAATFTLIQPEFIYAVIKQVTWVNQGIIFDGNSALSGTLLQSVASPGLAGRSSGSNKIGENNNATIGNFVIVRLLINGSSSKLIVNATTPSTGNIGAGNMNGLILGRRYDGLGHSNFQVKELIIRKVADNSTDETAIYNYLKSKYSL